MKHALIALSIVIAVCFSVCAVVLCAELKRQFRGRAMNVCRIWIK